MNLRKYRLWYTYSNYILDFNSSAIVDLNCARIAGYFTSNYHGVLQVCLIPNRNCWRTRTTAKRKNVIPKYLAVISSFVAFLQEFDLQRPLGGFRVLRVLDPESSVRRVRQETRGQNVPVPDANPSHLRNFIVRNRERKEIGKEDTIVREHGSDIIPLATCSNKKKRGNKKKHSCRKETIFGCSFGERGGVDIFQETYLRLYFFKRFSNE